MSESDARWRYSVSSPDIAAQYRSNPNANILPPAPAYPNYGSHRPHTTVVTQTLPDTDGSMMPSAHAFSPAAGPSRPSRPYTTVGIPLPPPVPPMPPHTHSDSILSTSSPGAGPSRFNMLPRPPPLANHRHSQHPSSSGWTPNTPNQPFAPQMIHSHSDSAAMNWGLGGNVLPGYTAGNAPSPPREKEAPLVPPPLPPPPPSFLAERLPAPPPIPRKDFVVPSPTFNRPPPPPPLPPKNFATPLTPSQEGASSFQISHNNGPSGADEGEDDLARVLAESAAQHEREMAERRQSEDEALAQALEESLRVQAKEQAEIEAQIRRSSRATLDSMNGWGVPGPSRARMEHIPENPTINITGSAQHSRTTTPVPPLHIPEVHPTGEHPAPGYSVERRDSGSVEAWGDNDECPPAYEEVLNETVAEEPIRLNPGLSPGLSTPVITSASSETQPSLLTPTNTAEDPFADPLTNSPLELSPHDGATPPNASPGFWPMPTPNAAAYHRPHAHTVSSGSSRNSSEYAANLQRSQTASSSGSHSARASVDRAVPLRTSRSSVGFSAVRGRPSSPVPEMPRMQMPVPQPTGNPRPVTPVGENRRSPSPFVPPPSVGGEIGVAADGVKRIVLEKEYTEGLSFGYGAPELDQPTNVIPPAPPFPETITLPPEQAFFISLPSWRQLLRVLARLGAVSVQPAPSSYALLRVNQARFNLRLVLHFHKCRLGGQWNTTLWLDLERPFADDVPAQQRAIHTSGDTTILPWGCRIPEQSIGGMLRGPMPLEIPSLSSAKDIVYVLQQPFPRLPVSFSQVADALRDADYMSRNAVSSGTPPSSEGVPQVDRGLAMKRLHKAIEKLYPASKSSPSTGVVDDEGKGKKMVAVGKQSILKSWVRSGVGMLSSNRDSRGGRWENEQVSDIITPYSVDGS